MKKIISILAAAILALSLCGTVLAETPAENFTAENGGLTISIPRKYFERLQVIAPVDAPDGTLFVVSEQASIDAVKGTDEELGAGWIFSIRKAAKEELNELRGGYLLGEEVFAKAEDGGFYLLCMPTDYRFIRQNYEGTEKEEALFREMLDWAVSEVPQVLIALNNLTPWTYTNTEVDQLFARILYGGSRNFTLLFLEENAHKPDKVDPAPWLEKLAEGVTIEEVDESETPDGEYIILNDPETDSRFDFFRADGNYVRQIWNGGQNQALFKVTFADSSLKVNSIISEWYEAVAAADQ